MTTRRKPQSVYQYEPLVTPSSWKGEERQFVVRLTQLLDQLFARKTSASVSVDTTGMVKSVDGVKAGTDGNVPLGAVRTVNGEKPDPATGNVEVDGIDGVGVPVGGGAGQILTKKSETDYDTAWEDPPEGGGGSVEEIITMSAADFESLTVEDRIALHTAGIRVVAVEDAVDMDELTDQQKIADFVYPVGIIVELATGTNPASLWGIGTWESYMPGRVLVGAGTADSGTVYEAGTTGGEETHTLTKDEMPSHYHAPIAHSGVSGKRVAISNGTADSSTSYYKLSYTSTSGYIGTAFYTAKTGGDAAHNIMQPYGVVYRWLRVA